MDSLSSSPSASSANYSFSAFATATNIPPAVLWVGTGRGRDSPTVSQMLGRLIWITLTCNFAIVCSFIGAMMGGLIGLATESGFLRGAGIGSMSAAVFSVEVIESTITLWRSNGLGICTFLYMIDIVLSLLSGSLVREKVVPAMQSALHSQMSAEDSLFIEALDMFDTGGTKGLPKDSVDKLPKINITTRCSVDPSGDRICCSVCLQDFEEGETARSLPHCQHMFHLPCIDGWLTMHGSCPLCRHCF